MAALVCDICGGKLVMGAGGIATCESCGMEHSQDRMKEKIQEIKGVVRVDNSHMVDNWMKMGLDAANAGNQKEAYDYFTKVIEVEPNNWRAIFEKGKAGAWQSTLGNSRTAELYQAVKTALAIISTSNMPEAEVAENKNIFAVAIYNVNNAFLDLRQQNFDKCDDKYYDLHWDEWWEVHYNQATANVSQTEDVISLIADLDDELSKKNVLEMKKHICEVLQYICSCQDTYWDSYGKNYLQCFGIYESTKKPFVEKYVQLVAEIREIEPDFRTSKYSQIDPWDPPTQWDFNRYDKLLSYWQKKDAETKRIQEENKAKKRFEEYWSEHSAEKQTFEQRLSAINEEKAQIQSTLSGFNDRIQKVQKEQEDQVADVSQELVALKDQISSLETQKSKLGLFAGKQKKEIQAQINSLKATLPNIEEKVTRAKAAINSDIDAKLSQINANKKPFSDRLAALTNEENSINTELTKAR